MYKIYTKKPSMPKGYTSQIWLIMRLTTVILIATFMQVYAIGFAQKISMSHSNAPLKKVLKELRSQSGYNFVYTDDLLRMASPVDISVNEAEFEDVLKEIFSEQPLTYSINKNTITVKEKGKIFLKNVIDDFKDIVVRGKITDAKGESLPGVSIKVKGTEIGTSTDTDGRFTLNVPDNATLVFTYIGYEVKEIAVNNQTLINVSLEASTTSLNEVVVTALGVKREVKSLTYGSQNINAKELSETRNLNVITSLQGKVAGMTISTNGTGLGGSTRVILRGNRSISGDSQPLYVVDGVPISGTISDMSPDNIESINVLKGPNAAALYGSAAQNGAIVVETKKGQEGVARVSLNNTFTAGTPIHTLELQNEYGQGVSGVYNRTLEESWGPKMNGQMVDHWSNNPALIGTKIPFSPQPNNFKDILQTSHILSNNLLITMGSKNTQTAFSYTRESARGMLQSNTLGRHDISVRVNSQLAKWLSFDTKLNYIQQALDNPNTTSDDPAFNPYRNIYRLPRNISQTDLADFEYTDANGKLRQNYWNPGSTSGKNPYWLMNRLLTLQDQKRVMALASLTLHLTENLNLLARSSYDGRNSTQERKGWADSYGGGLDFGLYGVSNSSSEQWNNDLMLSYKRDLTKNLNIVALLGGTIRTTGGEGSMSAQTTQRLNIPNFFSLSNTTIPAATYSPSSETETQSVYFSGNFGWKNAIYLDVTARNDWSSTLPAASRSYFYPSIGISGILNDLIPSLSNLFSYSKVRASWAEVGSSASPYMLSRTASFFAGGNNGFLQLGSVLPSTDLKPERTESIELGLDLRFFNNRLGFEFTAYKTNTYDQLFTIAMPTGSGAASFYTNGGDVENKGVEVVLSATPVQKSSGFKWNVGTNFAMNRNWVNKISDQRPRIIVGSDSYMREFVVEQGHEFGDMYSRGWQRDAQGRVIIGANGLPLITSGRTVNVANFNPDWMGAMSNSFSYKNFSASILIEHRQGGTIVSSTDAILYGEGASQGTLEGREGGLVFGQNLFAKETAVLADGTPNNIPINSQTFWRGVGGRNTPVGEGFIQDATNTRVREASLGFTLPKSLLTKLSIVSSVKLSLVGRNLFFIQRSGTWDSEILSGTDATAEGFQAFVPPTERNFGFNLKIDF